MILEYDDRASLTPDQKLKSLKENVQLALNEEADLREKLYRSLLSSLGSNSTAMRSQFASLSERLEAEAQALADAVAEALERTPGVELGVSGDSVYRKWDDGIAECWIYTTQNVAIDNAYGSLYQGAWTWNYPITFVGARPTVICSHFKWGTGASWGAVSDAGTTSATLRGIDAVSRASGSCVIAAYAIGKWK